ncbi:hypothetical protein GCM10017750_59830 [Streptomyces racemochromogenes]
MRQNMPWAKVSQSQAARDAQAAMRRPMAAVWPKRRGVSRSSARVALRAGGRAGPCGPGRAGRAGAGAGQGPGRGGGRAGRVGRRGVVRGTGPGITWGPGGCRVPGRAGAGRRVVVRAEEQGWVEGARAGRGSGPRGDRGRDGRVD